jgi:hypothetical protein
MAHAQLARAVHAMRRRGVRRENVRLTTTPTPSSHRAHTELTPSSRRASTDAVCSPMCASTLHRYVHPRCGSTRSGGCTPLTGCSSKHCPRVTRHQRAARRGARAEQGAEASWT